MPDTVTLILDAEQYNRALAQVTAGTGRLRAAGGQIGEGFIRGERVVRTASANIAASLLASGDAATTVLVAMQGLERVFKIGILPTVAVAGLIAIFEVFHKQIERTKEASDELGKELGKSLGLEVQDSVEAIGTNIDALTEKIRKLKKETSSPTNKFLNALLGKDDTEAAALRRAEHGRPEQLPETKEQKQLIEGESRLRELTSARADKEVKIAEAKRDQNKILTLELGYESQRAKLFDGAYKSGLNMVDLMKRLVALQIGLKDEVSKEVEARRASAAAAAAELEAKKQTFLLDVGSGKFLKDAVQKRAEDQQR
jgi:hypothetical protein